MNYIPLTAGDLAIAALLVLANAGLSWWLELGIGRRLLISAVRAAVQLALVGVALTALFSVRSAPWTAAMAVAMILLAGREATARQDRQFAGWWTYGIGTASMTMAATIVTLIALTTAIQPQPWYDPRYAIPLLGMILGNCMNGVSLGLSTLTATVAHERPAIEARLALGATRREALRPSTTRALRAATTPIVNAMSALGLVSLPGMMTGQILAGADPVEAAKYQLLIMFLIAGGTGLGAVSAVILGVLRLTDARHRLRLDRLRAA
ncbi:MAG: iron export ABC transporter permease subunit FetB [Alphaproteobacteria bacterium]|nr:iron export ABC transporter permease subunit FetB [Alphaproteobacteria bacterium]